jgi:hypothetical protein
MKNPKPAFWNIERLFAFSAVMISLATFGIYFYQTRLILKEQRASTMPYVMIGYSLPDGFHFRVDVVNNGLGPAFVEEVNVYDSTGKKYPNIDLSNYFGSIDTSGVKKRFSTSSILDGIVIPVNHSMIHIEAQDKPTGDYFIKTFWEKKPINLEIVYSSIYGERWSVKGGFTKPVKISE